MFPKLESLSKVIFFSYSQGDFIIQLLLCSASFSKASGAEGLCSLEGVHQFSESRGLGAPHVVPMPSEMDTARPKGNPHGAWRTWRPCPLASLKLPGGSSTGRRVSRALASRGGIRHSVCPPRLPWFDGFSTGKIFCV